MAFAWAFSLTRINDPTEDNRGLEPANSQSLPNEMWLAIGDLYTQTVDLARRIADVS